MFKILLLLLCMLLSRISSYGINNRFMIIHSTKLPSSLSSLSLLLSSSSLSSLSSSSPSSLPIGCIIATNNNLNEEQLEIIDDIIFNTVDQKFQPPVFLVGKKDMKLTLNKLS